MADRTIPIPGDSRFNDRPCTKGVVRNGRYNRMNGPLSS